MFNLLQIYNLNLSVSYIIWLQKPLIYCNGVGPLLWCLLFSKLNRMGHWVEHVKNYLIVFHGKINITQIYNDAIALKYRRIKVGKQSCKNNTFLIHDLCKIFYQFSFELCLLPTSIILAKVPVAKTLCGPTIWGKLKLFSRSNQLVTGLQHCALLTCTMYH